MTEVIEDPFTIAVDGETYSMDDLSFKERKEVRKLAREIADDPEAELEDMVVDDLLVAMVTVCKQKTDPAFTIDAAMELKPGDIVPQPKKAKPRPKAPTR